MYIYIHVYPIGKLYLALELFSSWNIIFKCGYFNCRSGEIHFYNKSGLILNGQRPIINFVILVHGFLRK